jgi:D-threonate/D-erythronate kinase
VSWAPSTVGLVADDLTGATDSALQFAEQGWTTCLERGPLEVWSRSALGAGRTLVAVATGIRGASDEQATAATAAAVSALMATGIDRLFLKIDSTVRGSVAAQARGALSAWRADHPGSVAVVCPAFPAQGRTVVDATVLVHGVPVAETAAAHDPVTPVTESRLDVLLPGALRADVPDLERLLQPEAAWSAGRPDLLVVDAATDDDLADLAEALDCAGSGAVAVGSAGLAAALARRHRGTQARPPATSSRRVLVVVSSVHPQARHQVERLRERCAGDGDDDVDVITTPAERAPADAPTPHATAIARRLADRVADRLATGRFDALVLVGGDGAAAVLDRLHAERVLIGSAIVPGAPEGRILGGPADGLRIVTKSGGFGDPDTLATLVRRLRDGPLPQPPSPPSSQASSPPSTAPAHPTPEDYP